MKNTCILSLVFIFFAFSGGVFTQQKYYTGFEPAPKEKLEKVKPFEEGKFRGEMKTALDMSADFPPVGDQGEQSSCVAWTIAYVLSYYKHGSYGSYYTGTHDIDCSTIFSPAFIYNSLNFCTNLGINYVDALDFVWLYGIVDMCEMPYNSLDYCTTPTREQYEKAISNRISDYYRANTIVTAKMLKEKINEGYPILIGVYVDNTFITRFKGTESTDYVWGSYMDSYLHGHAMIIVGYDDNKKAFKVMNSWGTQWGENGFIWISYDFIPYCTGEAYYIGK